MSLHARGAVYESPLGAIYSHRGGLLGSYRADNSQDGTEDENGEPVVRDNNSRTSWCGIKRRVSWMTAVKNPTLRSRLSRSRMSSRTSRDLRGRGRLGRFLVVGISRPSSVLVDYFMETGCPN